MAALLYVALLSMLFISVAVGDETSYYALAAVGCFGSGDSGATCPNIPGCGNSGCPDREAWTIPAAWGGAYPDPSSSNPARTPTIRRDTGTTNWIIFTRFNLTSSTPLNPNNTIVGMKLTMHVDGGSTDAAGGMVVPANAVQVRLPNTTFVSRVLPNAERSLPAVAIPVDVPAAGAESDLWLLTNGQNFTTLPWTDQNFGFAVWFKNVGGSDRGGGMRFIAAEMRIYSTPPGQTLPPTSATTTAGPTPTPEPGPPIGAIVGGVIGGVVVLAGLIVLIVFLARRAAVAQPEIRLDAPMN